MKDRRRQEIWPKSAEHGGGAACPRDNDPATTAANLILEASDLAPDGVVAILTTYVRRVTGSGGCQPRLYSLAQARPVVRLWAAVAFAKALGHEESEGVFLELDLWPDVLPQDPDLGYPLPVLYALAVAIGRRHAETVEKELDALRFDHVAPLEALDA